MKTPVPPTSDPNSTKARVVNPVRQRIAEVLQAQFVRNAFEASFVNGLGVFAALAAQAALAQALGAAGFGIYSKCVAAAAILSVFLVSGMDTALLREIPKAPEHTRELVLRAERFLVLFVVLSGPLLLLFLPGPMEVVASALLALFLAASTIRQFALRANFQIFWGRFPDIVIRPVLVAAFVSVMVSVFMLPVYPLTGIVMHALAAGCVYLIGSAILRLKVPSNISRSADGNVASSAPRVSARERSVWLGLSLLTILSLELDKLVGASLLAPADFGHYALAARIYGFAIVASESIAVVASPIASRLLAQHNRPAIAKLERDLRIFLSLIALVLFSIQFWFGPELVEFLAPGFDPSVHLLSILAFAILVMPLYLPRVAIASVLLPKLAWRIQIIAVALLGLSAVLGTLYFGAFGLAWGIVCGMLLRAVLWMTLGKLRLERTGVARVAS